MTHTGPRPTCITHCGFFVYSLLCGVNILLKMSKRPANTSVGNSDKKNRKHLCLSRAQKVKLLEKLDSRVVWNTLQKSMVLAWSPCMTWRNGRIWLLNVLIYNSSPSPFFIFRSFIYLHRFLSYRIFNILNLDYCAFIVSSKILTYPLFTLLWHDYIIRRGLYTSNFITQGSST